MFQGNVPRSPETSDLPGKGSTFQGNHSACFTSLEAPRDAYRALWRESASRLLGTQLAHEKPSLPDWGEGFVEQGPEPQSSDFTFAAPFTFSLARFTLAPRSDSLRSRRS
jgi:hypothetical protein